jgi:allophanate hydrolase subunit 2
MYATALAERSVDSSSTAAMASTSLTPVSVTLLANTTSWKALTGCQFTATVTNPACPAEISVAQSGGSYVTTTAR